MAGTSGDAQMAPTATGVSAGDDCRINDLPDVLLLRAISYLNARELVQTCVLSRRWSNLWRSVPRIIATNAEFLSMGGNVEDRNVLFKKFVNRFLMLRNPVALDEFRLCYNVGMDFDRLDDNSEDASLWIHHALRSNVSSVKVENEPFRLHLDSAVFASQCSLTTLQLSKVALFPGFFENLQTGCTALERLLLTECTIYDDKISSQTLKVWIIDDLSSFVSESDEQRPSISIPSLMHLGCFADGIPSLENMESLVTAEVSVGTTNTKVDDIRRFLRGLSGVTDLYFNYEGGKLEMEQNLQWCPKFSNLKTLTVGEKCHYEDDFYPLIVFLQNSPNLEHLTVKLSKDSGKAGRFIGDLEERSFTCKNLMMVEICCSGFEGSKDDPVVKSLVKLFHDNSITHDQICIQN